MPREAVVFVVFALVVEVFFALGVEPPRFVFPVLFRGVFFVAMVVSPVDPDAAGSPSPRGRSGSLTNDFRPTGRLESAHWNMPPVPFTQFP